MFFNLIGIYYYMSEEHKISPFFKRRLDHHKFEKMMRSGISYMYFESKNLEQFKYKLVKATLENYIHYKYNLDIENLPKNDVDNFIDYMIETYDALLKMYYYNERKIRGGINENYSPAGKEITPNNIVIHKSNPVWRENILKTGLQVSAGECYKTYVGYGVKCKPAIFATNSTNKRAWFDSTYDDDIWEINTEMIPDVKWYKDRHFESTKKHIVTFQNIPSEALTLKYEGSGRNDFLEESMSEELSNEKPSFLSAIKKFGLYYFMETTQIPITDIILKIGKPTRDIVERYIIDFVLDEGEEYYDEEMVEDGEFYVTIDLYLTGMKVIDKVITDGNLLEIEIIEYERVHGYNEEVANYINESKEFDDNVIYEIFNTVRKRKEFRRR